MNIKIGDKFKFVGGEWYSVKSQLFFGTGAPVKLKIGEECEVVKVDGYYGSVIIGILRNGLQFCAAMQFRNLKLNGFVKINNSDSFKSRNHPLTSIFQ